MTGTPWPIELWADEYRNVQPQLTAERLHGDFDNDRECVVWSAQCDAVHEDTGLQCERDRGHLPPHRAARRGP